MASSPRRVPPDVAAETRSAAEDAAGNAESAGAAIAFSAALGGVYLALQMLGLASTDGFIGPGALGLISAGCLTLGGGMILRARRTMKRLRYSGKEPDPRG